MRTARLRITMRAVVPRVERVIDVPDTITLDELHEVLQVALGWTDSHLHQFRTDTTIYAVPFEDWDDGEAEVDERGVPLSALAPRFVYAYDLGDGWEHDVQVLGRGDQLPGCVGGEGACPPEDCGGPYGYTELLEALADRRHPEHRSMRTWVGDRLGPFDQETTALRVRNAVGASPRSRKTCYRWPHCTTCCATFGYSASPTAYSSRQRRPATRSKPCAGFAPGSRRPPSIPSSPSARSRWSPPEDR